MNKSITTTYTCDFCGTTSDMFDVMKLHEKSCRSNPEVIAQKELERNGKKVYILTGMVLGNFSDDYVRSVPDERRIFGIYEDKMDATKASSDLKDAMIIEYYLNNKKMLIF